MSYEGAKNNKVKKASKRRTKKAHTTRNGMKVRFIFKYANTPLLNLCMATNISKSLPPWRFRFFLSLVELVALVVFSLPSTLGSAVFIFSLYTFPAPQEFNKYIPNRIKRDVQWTMVLARFYI